MRPSREPTLSCWSPNETLFARSTLKRGKKLVRTPVLIDLRNVYNPAEIRNSGFTYVSIGR